MLAHYAVRHEEAQPGAGLFGREVGLEEMVAILFRDARAIVGDAEERRTIAATTGLQVHAALLRYCVDRVVQQVRDDFPQGKWVSPNFDDLGRFSKDELDLLSSYPRPSTVQRTRY